MNIDKSKLESFVNSIQGKVLSDNTSEEFQQSLKKRWNADVHHLPYIIVYTKNVQDISKSIDFARENNLPFGVKGGGHGCKSIADKGLFVDLSLMRNVRVDQDKKLAYAQGGCLLGDLDRECAKYGLGVVSGHVSHTGLPGLVLGGGIGHLSRSFGTTADNLIEAELVTYDGKIHKVNETTDKDLLWALRGAGTNFGVVSEFVFNLYPVTDVILGVFVHPPHSIREALTKLGEFVERPEVPNAFSCAISMTPEGFTILGIFNGTEADAEPFLNEVASFGTPVVSQIQKMPYVALQSMIDDKVPSQLKYYQNGPFLKSTLTPDVVNVLLNAYDNHPTKSCAILITHLGGKFQDFDKSHSCFIHRDAKFQVILMSIIPDDSLKPAIKKWTGDNSDLLKKFTLGDYGNTAEHTQSLSSIYGENLDKLIEIKRKHDPTNFFFNNLNIKPY
ncbi:hypothetical protein CYY_005871 [Polysphondylium violaceum]|uniref:FAD-binding PCMH-type domain-containing protein n=1 Tax=Polysphondylium violaceum TaxID=133409 RepID=A0A8J4PRC0_9MYCE|nr:hypothetical protein CYY_005871 [Polysphondylium violaceum]